MTTVQVEDSIENKKENTMEEKLETTDPKNQLKEPALEPYTPQELDSTQTAEVSENVVKDEKESNQESEQLEESTPMVEDPKEEESTQEQEDNVDPLLFKEQIKWFSAMLRNMKKKKDAFLFLNPVDPVALNIPTYFTVIKKPMDISTIEKKLQASSYKNIEEAFSDCDLMFQNCYTFNGHESPVSLMAKKLQEWYQKECVKMPRSMSEIESKKKRKPALSHGLSRESVLEARPRRESFHGREESGKRKLQSKKMMTEMKFCNYVHREITKKQNHHFVYPFLAPVDPDALGIPHYRELIPNPMDLSTIRKKLDLSEYNTADEFEEDFRLMCQNCYTFNAAGTDVYNMGKKMEELFTEKWAEKANYLQQYGSGALRSRRDESSDDEDDKDAEHIQMLKTQLHMLEKQLQELMEKRSRRKKRRSTATAGLASNSLSASSTAQKAKPKPKSKEKKKKKRPYPQSSDDEKMPETDITYEQKRELSDNINMLSPDKLPHVFEIIKENTQLSAAEDEEIELDIDSLDKHVLWKLYLFVRKHTRPPKKPKYDSETVHTAGHAASSSESGSDDSGSASD